MAELAVKDDAIREQEFEEAARLRKKNKPNATNLKNYAKVEVEAKREFVAAITDEDIAEVVLSQWTEIPLKQMEKKKANVSFILKRNCTNA